MANMFMKLGDLKIKKGKGATALLTGGDKGGKDNYFTIRSLNFRVGREILMEIGNGLNLSTGKMHLSPVTFTKEMDGASEIILSRMLVPGEKGDTVDIIITKPDEEGKGAQVYLHVQLKKARVIECDLNIAEGAKPFECYAFAYSRILVKYWSEDEGGDLSPGGDVIYNLSTAEAESHAITGGGSSSPDAV
ncbi:type VI secretion system tube protein Hcp [Endozoicomonas gorgoniicola]|uniref:Type VI secretion system tube protein Hcp n=1 Tax=Endozoicomonas gorgoniicola TaxID=1234144 RepID=A0ABT3MQ17_9GAMM|nr:type VI secretion system tube protein Hcp [Endozoicomonas gorgoniicola]MCW7551129.1 type VI secretion system tube protein Hcp [Endozoicomonas gorgoniicola]